MKEKIEKLQQELKYILDEKYTLIDYLQDIWLDTEHKGIIKRHEAREMLKYLEKEVK